MSFLGERFRNVAAVCVGSKNALPTLSRRWMMESLARLGIPSGVLRLMLQLCSDYEFLLLFAGEVADDRRYECNLPGPPHEWGASSRCASTLFSVAF